MQELDRRRTFVRGLALLLVTPTAYLGVSMSSPAEADPYPQCFGADAVCRPDNAFDSWCFGDTMQGADKANLRQQARSAMNNAQNTTEIYLNESTSCGGGVDTRWREGGGLGALTLGTTNCTALAGPSNPEVCLAADVIINQGAHVFVANDPNNNLESTDGQIEPGEIDLNLYLTSCHEYGHHLGYQHHSVSGDPFFGTYGNDCTRLQWLEPEQSTPAWRTYNTHHRAHFNNNY